MSRRPHFTLRLASLLPIVVVLGGCGRPESEATDPPWARRDIVDELRADLAAGRHPSDGGGRAWVGERPPGPVSAGGTGRWELIYEAGDLGIAEGGLVFLQVSPFWGWSTPQVEWPDLPGYTEVETDAEGVELRASTLGQQLLGVRIGGRALRAGERLRLVYGAGPAGARVDSFAEAASPFRFAVDGDGDGVRGLVADPPTVAIVAAATSRLVLTLPSTARPGDRVRLNVALLDAAGNRAGAATATVRLETGLSGPEEVEIRPDSGGRGEIELTVPGAGVFTVAGATGDGLRARSNPLVVTGIPPIAWGDLHGHSGLSDGTGTPEDYFLYARDVAALDVVSLTDHDHWGMPPLADSPDLWRRIVEAAQRFHRPGRLVTLPGYEWTNWVRGHRHVLWFDDGDGARVRSSVDPAWDTPAELWAGLAGERALTVAHHSAGGPIATDWSFAPPPGLEPVTEVSSVHGSSEAADGPGRIYDAIAGNFVRDALGRGYRLGFVGSGDGHDGHPGLSHLATGQGGLAAIFTEELTREGVLSALRARRCYATNGPRIVLWTELEGAPMGAQLAAGTAGVLRARVVGTAPLERVDLVRGGRVADSVPGEGRSDLALSLEIPAGDGGDWLYLRVVQVDGGAAWSSPYFFD